jgi:hypothetical protein
MSAEPKAPCRIIWWVYTGRPDPETGRPERIRRCATMRGQWPGYDAECLTHEWESRTGGGVRSWIEHEVWSHKYDHGMLPEQQVEGGFGMSVRRVASGSYRVRDMSDRTVFVDRGDDHRWTAQADWTWDLRSESVATKAEAVKIAMAMLSNTATKEG